MCFFFVKVKTSADQRITNRNQSLNNLEKIITKMKTVILHAHCGIYIYMLYLTKFTWITQY